MMIVIIFERIYYTQNDDKMVFIFVPFPVKDQSVDTFWFFGIPAQAGIQT